MAAACAESRAHSAAGWPARANCTASAVPHDPAPTIAMRLAVLMLVAARGCYRRSRRPARGPLLDRLRVNGVEVQRLQQQRREPALANELGDRLAREGIQRVRAEAAD